MSGRPPIFNIYLPASGEMAVYRFKKAEMTVYIGYGTVVSGLHGMSNDRLQNERKALKAIAKSVIARL
ncbi:hypothetical protein AM231_23520 [Paenibacillus solani]|uniref:Uncharacterized protein n=1 Tax=Paenibacillus solani TaxID=1705565 RepID=A0A0M1N438_9BACL|nr:hypothetical protein AM231_23520 [Paenibacillus solani]